MESFDKDYDETIVRQTTLLASNIAETRKFSVKTPEIVVNVNPDRADLVDIQYCVHVADLLPCIP